jgi:hypothetical protein
MATAAVQTRSRTAMLIAGTAGRAVDGRGASLGQLEAVSQSQIVPENCVYTKSGRMPSQ